MNNGQNLKSLSSLCVLLENDVPEDRQIALLLEDVTFGESVKINKCFKQIHDLRGLYSSLHGYFIAK